MSNPNEQHWPGHIKLDVGPTERHSPGNRAVMLRTVANDGSAMLDAGQLLNEFSEQNPHALITSIHPMGTCQVLITYTAVMSREQIDRMGRLHKKAEELLAEEDRRANEAEVKMQEAQAKADVEAEAKMMRDIAEQARLAELGRKHEKNCGKKGKS